MKNRNAQEVLKSVELCLEELEDFKATFGYSKKFWMTEVYEELNIFDWWSEQLSGTQLKQMKSFLETAIKLGYKGYVCFKVGITGCANGMWAYKEESKDGYSPEGGCLYRSFTPAYTDWDIRDDNGTWLHNSDNKDKHTLKDIMKILAK